VIGAEFGGYAGMSCKYSRLASSPYEYLEGPSATFQKYSL
jgi:hypothetical protein